MHDQTSILGAPSGIRETKKAATRSALRAVARRLAIERGLENVTVEGICAAAGVSTRTFFNYYDSKESALVFDLGAPTTRPDARADFLAGRPTGDLLDDLMVLVDPTSVVAAEGKDDFLQTIELLHREPRLVAAAMAQIARHDADLTTLIARRRGVPPDDPSCATATAVVGVLIRRACEQWLTDDSLSLPAHMRRVRAQIADFTAPQSTAAQP